MVFNATFNNISVITWQSVLLVEKTEYPEKTTDLSQVTDKLYNKCVRALGQIVFLHETNLIKLTIHLKSLCKLDLKIFVGKKPPSCLSTSFSFFF